MLTVTSSQYLQKDYVNISYHILLLPTQFKANLVFTQVFSIAVFLDI